MSEDRLDQALSEMRKENVPAGEASAARERVWERLAGMQPPVCAEFQQALPAYEAGGLDADRRLLLEDHLGRCPSCRRALAELRGERRPSAAVEMPRRRALPAWTRWALAAGLAAMALYLGRGPIDHALAPSGPRATLVRASGSVALLPAGVLTPGGALAEGQHMRTGMGARATLRLMDGSLVEVNERTELSVESTFSRRTIRLERGDIIVQAAPQSWRRLQVISRDSQAMVKGTVFAVSSGLAGSVVAVVEGAVQVRQPRGQRLLRRGELAASTTALEGVPVERAISWSENAEKYFALLGELAEIRKAAAASVPAPRTQSGLLAYLPSSPVLYAAFPNLGPTIEQTVNLIEQRAQQSTVLREWWTSSRTAQLKQLMGRIQAIAPLVGDEIVFVLSKPPLAGDLTPVVLTAVQPGKQEALKQELAQTFQGSGTVYEVSDKLLAVSDSAAHLRLALAGLGGGAATPFAAEIASHYKEGVGVLVAVDAAGMGPQRQPAMAEVLGASHVKYLLFEQRGQASAEEMRASVVFDGPRTGIASWLATPGPAGSAEYVSGDAVLAVSASTKDPREAFDEFAALAARIDPNFAKELAAMETQTGVNIANDIASALGTDFTFAVERPSIPVPGWFVAMEVRQPATIDAALRQFAESVNQKLTAEGRSRVFKVEEQVSGGRTWMVLTPPEGALSLYWTYDRGYLVASTDRDIAMQAIATRNGGFPLIRSQKFQAQLPASSTLHQSAFVWLNTQGALADAAALMGNSPLKAILASREPLLVAFNAERERIQAAGRTRFMDLVFTAMLAGGPGPLQQSRIRTGQSDGLRR